MGCIRHHFPVKTRGTMLVLLAILKRSAQQTRRSSCTGASVQCLPTYCHYWYFSNTVRATPHAACHRCCVCIMCSCVMLFSTIFSYNLAENSTMFPFSSLKSILTGIKLYLCNTIMLDYIFLSEDTYPYYGTMRGQTRQTTSTSCNELSQP